MKHTFRTALAAAAVLLGGAAHAQKITADQATQFQKINQVMYLIANGYVDTVNMPKLVEGAIVNMLGQLDPHSTYLSAEELKTEEEEVEGNFEGIGIEFNVLRDTIVVVNTIPGGPSEQVGLMSGDRIVYVNGELKTKVKLNDVPKFLRGPKGTRADLRVVRPGVADTLEFSIVRDKIPMYSLDAAYKVDKNTGYVKLNRFMATTNDELQKALGEMKGISSLTSSNRAAWWSTPRDSICRVRRPKRRMNSRYTATENWSCWWTRVRHRLRRSWPGPCRTGTARRSSAGAPLARGSFSSRCRSTTDRPSG